MAAKLSIKPKFLIVETLVHEKLLKRWQSFIEQSKNTEDEILCFDRYLTLMADNGQCNAAMWTFFSLYMSAKEKLHHQNSKTSIKLLQPLQAASLKHLNDLGPEPTLCPQWQQLVTIKLNGGLGTSMGCDGPKSLIPVIRGENFLELIFKQQQTLNQKFNFQAPLFFMNSMFTQEDCAPLISNSFSQSFQQNHFPRISLDPKKNLHFKQVHQYFYPPGHGDVFSAFQQSGHLARLIQQGVTHAFISNSDNLAAIPDPRILTYVIDKNIDFLMEVTPKTKLDIKGGALTLKNGKMHLLEKADVPDSEISLFEDYQSFQLFNTNNLWVNLKALQKKLALGFSLPVILNQKHIENQSIYQIETAMGSALDMFENSEALLVDRNRFLPIKNTSDLFLLQSDLILKDQETGFIQKNPLYKKSLLPCITFPKELQTMQGYESYVKSIPSLLHCHSLELSKPCQITHEMNFKGSVKL